MENLSITVSPLAKNFLDNNPLSDEEKKLQLALFFYPYMLNGAGDIGIISKLMGISRVELMYLYEKAEVPIYVSKDPIDMDKINSLINFIKK